MFRCPQKTEKRVEPPELDLQVVVSRQPSCWNLGPLQKQSTALQPPLPYTHSLTHAHSGTHPCTRPCVQSVTQTLTHHLLIILFVLLCCKNSILYIFWPLNSDTCFRSILLSWRLAVFTSFQLLFLWGETAGEITSLNVGLRLMWQQHCECTRTKVNSKAWVTGIKCSSSIGTFLSPGALLLNTKHMHFALCILSCYECQQSCLKHSAIVCYEL